MDELREFFSRIRLVRMRTPNILKVILTIVIVLCMVVLIGLKVSVYQLNQKTEKLQEEAVGLGHTNADLQEQIDELGSVQSVIDIAREELGLVEPGSIVYEAGPAPETEPSEGN